MNISHKGESILVREGHDDRCQLQFRNHSEDIDKKFPAACRHALKWLLDNAGEMKGDYTR